MENRMNVVTRIHNKEHKIMFVGSYEECKAFLFNKVTPNAFVRNIKSVDDEYGYHFIVKTFYENKWITVEYYLQVDTRNM